MAFAQVAGEAGQATRARQAQAVPIQVFAHAQTGRLRRLGPHEAAQLESGDGQEFMDQERAQEAGGAGQEDGACLRALSVPHHEALVELGVPRHGRQGSRQHPSFLAIPGGLQPGGQLGRGRHPEEVRQLEPIASALQIFAQASYQGDGPQGVAARVEVVTVATEPRGLKLLFKELHYARLELVRTGLDGFGQELAKTGLGGTFRVFEGPLQEHEVHLTTR